jgi:hypothetical protein
MLYLPEPLHDAVADVPGLAPRSVVLYTRRGPAVQRGSPDVGRFAVLSLAVVVALLLVAARRWPRLGRAAGVGVVVVAPMIAMTGLGVWFFMATSTLSDMVWNENAIAMWPTDIVLVYPALHMAKSGEPPRAAALFRSYVIVRWLATLGLVIAKLIGWAQQDNAVFVTASFVLLSALFFADYPLRGRTRRSPRGRTSPAARRIAPRSSP